MMPKGFYLELESPWDSKPIVLVFTGFRYPSGNVKTGAMIQSHILRRDIKPYDAVKTAEDYSICKDCKHRLYLWRQDKDNRVPCYVCTWKGETAVYKTYKNGGYEKLNWNNLSCFYDSHLRIGAYGDPVTIPLFVWMRLLTSGRIKAHTGYTSLWRLPQAQPYKAILMASVDNPTDAILARELGWKTFRILHSPEDTLLPGESICPASIKPGNRRKIQCIDCLKCCGRHGSNKAIVKHGFLIRGNQ